MLSLSRSVSTSSVLGEITEPKQNSLYMSDPAICVLKVLSLACSWRTWDKAVWGAWAGWGRSPEGGEGQLTVGPGVPFRLLVTACPARNVFFKTCLSSNAGYYNNKRTSSAVWEDANTATLHDSQSKAMPTSVKYCGQLKSGVTDTEAERPLTCAYKPDYEIAMKVLNVKLQRISHDLL